MGPDLGQLTTDRTPTNQPGRQAAGPDVSIVVPVFNERDNIVAFLTGLRESVRSDAEILIVYDFDEDNTLPAVKAMESPPTGIRFVKNDLGRGVVNALRAGLAAARGRAIVVTMADCSDDPAHIDLLAQRIFAGADVVAGSRYCRGGRQIGGPLFKRTLSRLAGVSLHWVAGLPVHDATNSFRAYSRRVAREIAIESTGGFEIGIELTVKAFSRGWRVEEIPTTWRDRTAGEARFRLWKWLPRYLRWYGYGLAAGLLKPRWPLNRQQVALLLLLLGGLVLLLRYGLLAEPGVRLGPEDFSPQSSRGAFHLGWAFIGPDGTQDPRLSNNETPDPAPDQYMAALRTVVPEERCTSHFDAPVDGPLAVWVANFHRPACRVRFWIEQDGARFELTADPASQVRRHKSVWMRFLSQRPLVRGPCRLVAESTAETSPANLAQFSDIIVRSPGAAAPRVPRFDAPAEGLRLLAVFLLLLGAGQFMRWRHHRATLAVLCIGLAHYIEYSLPTLGWDWTDDDWWMMSLQSPLLEGDLSGLLASHQGHITPVYRAIRFVCYWLWGTDGTGLRVLNALCTLGAALLLFRLLTRWTGRAFAGAVGAALFLVNLGVQVESIQWTSCNPVSFSAAVLIAALWAFDHYLRRRRIGWLLATALLAMAAPFLFAGGVIVFPLLLLQMTVLRHPRISLRTWVASAVCGALAFIIVFVTYRVGIENDPFRTQWDRGANANLLDVARWNAALSAMPEFARVVFESFAPNGLRPPWLAPASLWPLLLLPLLPTGNRRIRRALLAGLVAAFLGYFVVLFFRSDAASYKSRYHYLACIGVMVLFAAATASLVRRRRIATFVRPAVIAMFSVFFLWGVEYLERGTCLYTWAFERQRRAVQAVERSLPEQWEDAAPRVTATDRVRYLTASVPPRLEAFAAVVGHRGYAEPLSTPEESVDLSQSATRAIYRNLLAEHTDGLFPDSSWIGHVLAAWPQADVAFRSFFSLSAANDAEALARISLCNGLERDGRRWFSWLPAETALQVYVSRSCRADLQMTLGPGMSNPEPLRTIVVTCNGQRRVWKLAAPEAAPVSARFDLAPGVNLIELHVREPRTVPAQPNGDRRSMMLVCSNISITID